MLFYFAVTLLVLNGVSAQRRPYPIPSRPLVDPTPPPGRQQPSDILEQISDISPDGSFHTKWATADGTTVEEFGQPKKVGDETVVEVQGSGSWTLKDGEQISLSWRADENGIQFQGDHLPTPPPIPPQIQRALDYIAANPPKDDAGPQASGFASTRRPAGRGF